MKRLITIGIIFAASATSALAAAADEAQHNLMRMHEGQRAEAFQELFKTAGKSCDSVARSVLQGTDEDATAVWSVECRNGKSYSVTIRAVGKGSLTIRECSESTAAGGVECWTKYPPPK